MLHRSSILLALTLLSCDKEKDRVPDLKPSADHGSRNPRESRPDRQRDESAPAFRQRKTSPGQAASETDIRTIREGAAKYATTDPAAGLEWIAKTAGGSDDALRQGYAALLDEMMKSKPEDAIALLDKPAVGPYRQAFTLELYSALTRKDPARAWALLKENPGGAAPPVATRAIVTQQINRDGINGAYQSFRANNESLPNSFFLSSIASEKGLSPQDAAAAMGMLRQNDSEAGFPRALGVVISNIQPADRALVTSYLADRPAEEPYDQGYRAATTLLLDSGSPEAAYEWASRITNPVLKEAARAEIRDSLKTVDAATRDRVDKLLLQK
ncbi:hypothetical protein KBB96_10820 [Luteolibacter ambystomatis]|uniref:Uncharacterized protein n=1 Tax=Luteolibacter ambystomatis TaxID=2824561 RepID=A0A975IXZ9_9BACT|nr:hypothetical protein [Luteolibacter ambystomatis]QUE49363.1 hypothetical protein KBB96_10820 [Luteolibacter ambystomatis]